MSAGANADQVTFWNSDAGRRWVTHEADLDAIHAAAATLLLEESGVRPGEAVLDIGCGSGATTLAFAAAVAPGGRVLGLDISAPLIARADERRGAAAVTFRLADAQTDPLPQGAFDLAVSRFGVMFFDDPVAAFRNIAGALRPNGRLLFAAWSGADANPWFALPMRLAVARLGPPAPQPPGAPGPLAFADRNRVVGLLETAGLGDCSAEERAIILHHPGGVPAILDLAAHLGPTARLRREKNATPADAAAIAEALADGLAGYATADGVRLPGGVNLFRAVRPG